MNILKIFIAAIITVIIITGNASIFWLIGGPLLFLIVYGIALNPVKFFLISVSITGITLFYLYRKRPKGWLKLVMILVLVFSGGISAYSALVISVNGDAYLEAIAGTSRADAITLINNCEVDSILRYSKDPVITIYGPNITQKRVSLEHFDALKEAAKAANHCEFIRIADYTTSANKNLPELITPSPTQPAMPLTISDWMEYVNEQYKFSIKYPSDWEKIDGRYGVAVLFYHGPPGQGANGVWGKIFVNQARTPDIATFAKQLQLPPQTSIPAQPVRAGNTYTTNNGEVKISNITIDGYDAMHFSAYAGENQALPYHTRYTFIKNNMSYTIFFQAATAELEQRNMPIYESMVNSFRFTQ